MGIDSDEFDELATAPKRTTGDEGTIEERSTDELIKADQYSATKNANRAVWPAVFQAQETRYALDRRPPASGHPMRI